MYTFTIFCLFTCLFQHWPNVIVLVTIYKDAVSITKIDVVTLTKTKGCSHNNNEIQLGICDGRNQFEKRHGKDVERYLNACLSKCQILIALL